MIYIFVELTDKKLIVRLVKYKTFCPWWVSRRAIDSIILSHICEKEIAFILEISRLLNLVNIICDSDI